MSEEIIKKIHELIITNNRMLSRHHEMLTRQSEMLVHCEMESLRNYSRYDNPKSLMRFGRQIYSQIDEDGIIREIFSRIGTINKIFVEFGIGNGLANNTAALLFDGWRGLWIDSSEKYITMIKDNLSAIIDQGRLNVLKSFITRDNINDLIASNIDCAEIDLLSVDIDGNDYHILQAITCISPRVIVIEYNAKFPPPISFCMDYNESHTWQDNDCFGASLTFLERHLQNYSLVGCNLSGVNAFFVRNDLVGHHFLEPYSAEKHYEPARYYLIPVSSGHKASYKTLGQSQTVR